MMLKCATLAFLAACVPTTISADGGECHSVDGSCNARADGTSAGDAMFQRKEQMDREMQGLDDDGGACDAWGCSCQGLHDSTISQLHHLPALQLSTIGLWFHDHACATATSKPPTRSATPVLDIISVKEANKPHRRRQPRRRRTQRGQNGRRRKTPSPTASPTSPPSAEEAACLLGEADEICSLDPDEQLWEGPAASKTLGGTRVGSYFVWDLEECQDTCQSELTCKGFKFTHSFKVMDEGKNCVLYSDEDDTAGCECPWQFYKRIVKGSAVAWKTCKFWGDPHYKRSFFGKKFDFMGIGLFNLASSTDTNIMLQSFHCEWAKDESKSVAVGVAVQLDGKITYFGPETPTSDIHLEAADVKIHVKKTIASQAHPGWHLDATVKLKDGVAAAEGICGAEPPPAPVECGGVSLFTQEQSTDMCNIEPDGTGTLLMG